jgi:hypothetical protein
MRIKLSTPTEDTAAARRKNAVRDYVEARALADRALETVKKAEARLVEVLDEEEIKSSSVEEDGVKHTVTLAAPRTTVSYDEAGLKKTLGAKTYAKISVSKLDKAKLEAAVQEGEIDSRIVAQHATVSTGARSVRLTRKVAEESDSAPS